jgi:aminoglycoside 3-N-acetyltransferase
MFQRVRQIIREHLPHRPEFYRAALFGRTGPRGLERFLAGLGVREGRTLFVHVSFGALGYFRSGPDGLLDLLVRLLGPEGTLVLPSFPFTGSMMAYASTDPMFDVRYSPSRVGVVTEVFRKRPGVRRSLHPTHPVCALGRHADELVEGHERCPSPCGSDSPFDRLASLDAWVLRLGTSVITLGHLLQDRARVPGIYLKETRKLRVIDGDGRVRWVETRVFRPGVPDIFILGRDSGDQVRNVRRRDYPFLFPGDREARLGMDPSRREALAELRDQRAQAAARGDYGWGRINGCAVDCFSIRAYLQEGSRRLAQGLAEFPELYHPNRLASLRAGGLFP